MGIGGQGKGDFELRHGLSPAAAGVGSRWMPRQGTSPCTTIRIVAPSSKTRLRRSWLIVAVVGVDLGLEDADVGQVAVPFGVVQAVADDELVRKLEAPVLDVDVD